MNAYEPFPSEVLTGLGNFGELWVINYLAKIKVKLTAMLGIPTNSMGCGTL
jgi:hypothetical protein